MVGLGCGARSYTKSLHYSSDYAVGASGVREILHDYIARPDESFDVASHGFKLNLEEQKRRFVVKSLLQIEGLSQGLDTNLYKRYFDSDVFVDYPMLHQLEEQELAIKTDHLYKLSDVGLERSDAIGPLFYSKHVQMLTEAYELR